MPNNINYTKAFMVVVNITFSITNFEFPAAFSRHPNFIPVSSISLPGLAFISGYLRVYIEN